MIMKGCAFVVFHLNVVPASLLAALTLCVSLCGQEDCPWSDLTLIPESIFILQCLSATSFISNLIRFMMVILVLGLPIDQ